MKVLPDDLANLCALFVGKRGQSIRETDLYRRLRDGLRIDSSAPPEEIIKEAVRCRLITLGDNHYEITAVGKVIAGAQGEVGSTITPRAKDALLRRVYLNYAADERCCGHFMQTWEPDVESATFALIRGDHESSDTFAWLYTLQRVGLIDVNADRALVKQEYLGAVNELLAQVRGVSRTPDSAEEKLKQEIGDIGEDLAVAYEKNRLRSNGLDWLTPAVRHISPIDSSAGYDILSCLGTGRSPDRPIYVEVKATTNSAVQFFWSYNERRVALDKGASYWIYVYTNVDIMSRSGKGPKKIRNPRAVIKPPEFDIECRDVFVRRV